VALARARPDRDHHPAGRPGKDTRQKPLCAYGLFFRPTSIIISDREPPVKLVKPVAVAALSAAVVAGGIAVSLTDAAASANPSVASVSNGQLYFTAGNGTANHLSVTARSGGGFTLTDTAATISLSSPGGCVLSADKFAVQCPGTVIELDASLADGDDTFNNQTATQAVVEGSDGDDTLIGGSGADSLHGGDGADLIYGGYGDDVLDGDDGVDTVYGQAGDDVLSSFDNNDALWGGSGRDRLAMGLTMHGDDDDDVLVPGRHGEIWGGTEFDTINYSTWTQLANVSLDGVANDGSAGTDPTNDPCGGWLPGGCIPGPMNVHGDIEKIIGTKYNDTIIGNGNANQIDAGAGNDAIDGGGGNDYLDVEAGSQQRVHGGSGTDTCVGYGITVKDGCEN
jgi:Ca2+-binding RTX toxin-like protein